MIKKPGKVKARKIAVAKKAEETTTEGFSFSNEENPLLRLRGGGAEDSDSESGKDDDKNGPEASEDEAKEKDKDEEEGRVEVARISVSDKSGNVMYNMFDWNAGTMFY